MVKNALLIITEQMKVDQRTVEFDKVKNGTKTYSIKLNKNICPQILFLTVSVDNVHFFYEKLIKE